MYNSHKDALNTVYCLNNELYLNNRIDIKLYYETNIIEYFVLYKCIEKWIKVENMPNRNYKYYVYI